MPARWAWRRPGSRSRSSASASIAAAASGQPGLLSIPTVMLAAAPDLIAFAALRVAQGLSWHRVFADAGLSGRATSAEDPGGLSRLYHRQCRQQPGRTPRRRPALADHLGFAANFAVLAALNLAGRRSGLFASAQPGRCRRPTRAGSHPFAIWADHLRNRAAAGQFRHRLLHPLRLHRHIHLREFRACPGALRNQPDGAGFRLFRVPAVDRHDAVGGRGGSARAARE